MLAQLISVKQQGKGDKKEVGVSCFAHIAKEVATLWRNAIKYTAIQVQTSKEADQGHSRMQTMSGQMLKRERGLLPYFITWFKSRTI